MNKLILALILILMVSVLILWRITDGFEAQAIDDNAKLKYGAPQRAPAYHSP